MTKPLPRYPVYVISKGRAERCLTARFLLADGVPFRLVVEPQEADLYRSALPSADLVVLPFSNLGLGSIPARNWVWEHAKASGAERHWILDDNIRYAARRYRSKRIRCDAGVAFAASEDFVDRYENVAVAGLAYYMFAPDRRKFPPFWLNVHVYSCLLIRCDLPHRWRGRYNEDTDLCLQVLSAGWCTVMTMKGGNTDELYKGDGRLAMARSLEKAWPGVVETKRRFSRPQHVVKNQWRMFDTPLKLREGVVLPTGPNEYGMELRQVKDVVKSEALRRLLQESKG